VRQPVRRRSTQLERIGVGDTRAPYDIRDGRTFCLAEGFDLRGSAVHQHHADVQGAQHRDSIARWRVFVGDDGTVNGEDERLLANAEYIAGCPAGGPVSLCGWLSIFQTQDKVNGLAAIQ